MSATRYALSFLVGTAVLAAAGPAEAQVDDTRWLAFIGCWQPPEGSEEAGLLCFRPAPGGVEMTNIVGGEVVSTEQLAADGEARPVVAEGCEGTEAVSFSEDGRRVFTTSDFTCGEDVRSGTGVMAMVAPNRWVDVRSLDVRGEKIAWVQSYQLVGLDRLAEEGIDDPRAGMEASVRAARMAAAASIDLEDVAEATERLDSETVVAWVAAQGDEFDLDGDELLRLADAGMPEEVIDVVVAVSYPDRFVVEPEQNIAMAEATQGRRIPVGVGYRGYRGYLGWDPFYHGYSPWGFGYSRFGYAPFGYGPIGYYPYGGYGYVPTRFRVERRASGGRVVRGEGYRPGPGSIPRSRAARPRGDSSGPGMTGSDGRAGVAPSARPSTGRTAVRRGGRRPGG